MDFKDFIVQLNKHDVAYMVVGGFAVAVHGYPRYTGDIDFWIKRDQDNAGRLVSALTEVGVGSLGLSVTDFIEADRVVQMGYPPNRIDLLTSVTGLSFDDCVGASEVVSFENVPIRFIGLDDLKKNKSLTGRKKDELDLENLP